MLFSLFTVDKTLRIKSLNFEWIKLKICQKIFYCINSSSLITPTEGRLETKRSKPKLWQSYASIEDHFNSSTLGQKTKVSHVQWQTSSVKLTVQLLYNNYFFQKPVGGLDWASQIQGEKSLYITANEWLEEVEWADVVLLKRSTLQE